ncbi:transposase [uncultured Nocardioides sp.]|uniref:transposase n=1 Tax=uncultured Nocardioides sp. TaxID=198441 RepID=UPI00261C077D|nr:transposase [uncultured Nocardioides sp.]
MAKPYPQEFRDDVVAVARQGQASLKQIAKDFGISEGSLTNWMKQARHRGRAPSRLDRCRACRAA